VDETIQSRHLQSRHLVARLLGLVDFKAATSEVASVDVEVGSEEVSEAIEAGLEGDEAVLGTRIVVALEEDKAATRMAHLR
jgi:hypothetical protein